MRRAPAPRVAAWLTCALAFALAPAARADGTSWLGWTGYVREEPVLWSAPVAAADGARTWSSRWNELLHARGNLRLYPAKSATIGVECKARAFAGDGARDLADLTDLTATRQTWFAWSRRPVDEPSRVVALALDRAWLALERGPAQLTVGRQRIAWGTALVWNPIDRLNPSSPLDFDDVEKPGTDAARAVCYLGPTSKVDVAAVPARRADDATALAEVVVNHAGFDWVLMGGRQGAWTLAGGAWAGSIGGGGFRGEWLAAAPREGLRLPGADAPERANVVATLDGDYTFHSSLSLHGAALYNARGAGGDAGGARLAAAWARGWLSPARWSLYGAAGRDLGPLVHADLAAIANPGDRSWYAGPTVTWSALADLDVAVSGLLFGGRPGTEFGDDGRLLLARAQWSF